MVDYYKILQVQPDAEIEVIQAAYRRLSRKYHPDTNNSPDSHERMTNINQAYEILSDPLKRVKYDQNRISQEKQKRVEEDDTQRIAAELALPRLKREIQTLEVELKRKQQENSLILSELTRLQKQSPPSPFLLPVLVFLLCGCFNCGLWDPISNGMGNSNFINFVIALMLIIFTIAPVVGSYLWRLHTLTNDKKLIEDFNVKYKEGLREIEKHQNILNKKIAEYHHYQEILGALF